MNNLELTIVKLDHRLLRHRCWSELHHPLHGLVTSVSRWFGNLLADSILLTEARRQLALFLLRQPALTLQPVGARVLDPETSAGSAD